MIEKLMAQILAQHSHCNSINLSCGTLKAKLFLLKQLNAICTQNKIEICHYVHLEGTLLTLPLKALMSFSVLFNRQNYLHGNLNLTLDISASLKQIFPEKVFIDPAHECVELKKRVLQLEQENAELKTRLTTLEKAVSNLLAPVDLSTNRYAFYTQSQEQHQPAQNHEHEQVTLNFNPMIFFNK